MVISLPAKEPAEFYSLNSKSDLCPTDRSSQEDEKQLDFSLQKKRSIIFSPNLDEGIPPIFALSILCTEITPKYLDKIFTYVILGNDENNRFSKQILKEMGTKSGQEDRACSGVTRTIGLVPSPCISKRKRINR